MNSNKTRLRFAPSPTGMMHLGNIRTALINYLFAKKDNGTFIIRIEDTDPERVFDPGAKKIQEDLQWLGLIFDEGPSTKSHYAPYFQSKRTHLYQEKLNELIDKGLVYRCFCTQDELQKKRERQKALKLPPRYDGTCAKLTSQELQKKLDAHTPFIWRMKLNPASAIEITDIGKGTVHFAMKHFSDFPITRQDGSFTFMFANFVDDLLMDISHVVRGEDHLSNTAGQAALYHAVGAQPPTFWHLPILVNKEGKKLSKREFGFALTDLRTQGYLPEALVNYLALIGGGSHTNEICSLDELVTHFDSTQMHSGGQVTYDLEKLNWMNKKWIERLTLPDLVERVKPYLHDTYPIVATLDSQELNKLIAFAQPEATVLSDFVPLLKFYFKPPQISFSEIAHYLKTSPDQIQPLVVTVLEQTSTNYKDALKQVALQNTIPLKDLFTFIRLSLVGKPQGPGIQELIELLGPEEIVQRIQAVSKNN